jgi:hypothetical protein
LADICFHQRISKHRERLQETLLVRYTVIGEEDTSQGSHSLAWWSLHAPTALISKSCALFPHSVRTCFCKILAIRLLCPITTLTGWYGRLQNSVRSMIRQLNVCIHIYIYIHIHIYVLFIPYEFHDSVPRPTVTP